MFKINNYQITPYSLYLTVKYYIYINVEIYTFIKAVKYIHKYIYKGSDRTTLQLTDGDEVNKYL